MAALRGIYPGVQLSPDGRTLAARHADGSVRRWDLATKQQTGLLTDHSKGMRQVTVSPARGGSRATRRQSLLQRGVRQVPPTAALPVSEV